MADQLSILDEPAPFASASRLAYVPSTFVGEVLDLDPAVYHTAPAVGSTDLSLALRSLFHFERKKSGAYETETTPALALGTLAHLAILEPERFARDVVVEPRFDAKTKSGRAERDAWREEAKRAGKLVVDDDELAKVRRMADAIMGHARARRAFELRPYLREASYFWTDEPSRVPCKCRPDHLAAGGLLAVDLKTSRDASPGSFAKSIVNFGYHRQRAHYLAGVEAVTGVRPEEWIFVVVESAEPHAAAVYTIDDDFVELGERSREKALARIASGVSSGQWSSYGDGQVIELQRPRWATEED